MYTVITAVSAKGSEPHLSEGLGTKTHRSACNTSFAGFTPNIVFTPYHVNLQKGSKPHLPGAESFEGRLQWRFPEPAQYW